MASSNGVVLESTDGGRYSAAVDVFHEMPGLTEKRDRIRDKFLGITAPLMGETRAREIMERVISLEEAESMKKFIRMIRF